MDVFEVDGEIEAPILDLLLDVLKPRHDLVPVLFREDAAFRKHPRVGNGTADILMIHALVEVDRGLELVDHLIGALREAASPHCLAHFCVFSCMSARTSSGRPKRLMKPVASAWL